MRIDAVSIGKIVPHDVNVIIEVPVGGEPIKYEMDKEAGTLVVDRFLYTAMRYPGNYGFIPHTLSGDGDPCDVLVANTRAIVPGAELEKLINRRGPQWWDSAIRKGSRVSVLVFGDKVAGYANYGRNRARSLHFEGEIYELYLRPEFQGLGFGRRLFTAAKRDLIQSGLKSMVIWALSDNEPAVEFYRNLGGRMVARSSERFGVKSLDKVAFAWTA